MAGRSLAFIMIFVMIFTTEWLLSTCVVEFQEGILLKWEPRREKEKNKEGGYFNTLLWKTYYDLPSSEVLFIKLCNLERNYFKLP